MSLSESYLDSYDEYQRTGYTDGEFDFYTRGDSDDHYDYDDYDDYDDEYYDDRWDGDEEDQAAYQERQRRNDAVALFVLVVYLCDECATVRPAPVEPESQPGTGRTPAYKALQKKQIQELRAKSERFFSICAQLPMELQDRICRLVYDAKGKAIKSQEVEAGIAEVEEGFLGDSF